MKKTEIIFFDTKIKAGFPSPADDLLGRKIDLNQELIKNPTSTFFAKVSGDSMEEDGIFDGDYIVVDRSIDPKPNSIVVAIIEGEFTIKRYTRKNNQIVLEPANKKYAPIKITPHLDFNIWGVVVSIFRKLQ